MEFWVAVRAHLLNGNVLTVAMHIYRQTMVRHDRTVKLAGQELAELRVNRKERHKALHVLAAAGLIRLRLPAPGRATEVELLWRPSSDDVGAAG
jgi:hypothetical protein